MADEPDSTPEPEPAEPRSPPTDDLADFGPDQLRELVRQERRANKQLAGESAAHRHDAKRAKAALEQMEREHETEAERREREIREDERVKVTAAFEEQASADRRRTLEARIEARAAVAWAHPEIAVRVISLENVEAAENQDQAIDAELAAALERMPELAREQRLSLITQGARSRPPDGRPAERDWIRR